MDRVLIVDDEENLRLVLSSMLRKQGFKTERASSGEDALSKLTDFDPDYVIADVRMPGMSGIQLCKAIAERDSDATVIVMSAFGSMDLALEAMKAGAYDYLAKPFKQEEVILALRKAQERQSLRRENRALRAAASRAGRFEDLLGQSPAIKRVFALIDKAASFQTTVLIQGESGTGKELVARALHDRSTRNARRFVAVNCGAIPSGLLESELFGHRRGAFTDAVSDKAGLFEQADHGTLLLDEVGELPMNLQVKLLRALQEGKVRPLGAESDLTVDVRIIAATMKRLEEEVEAGRFREDLFYRLNVLTIEVPPLRDRRDDIALLVDHFIARSNEKLGTSVEGVQQRALKLLLQYPWPGNVRELENMIERACVLAESENLSVRDFPDKLSAAHDPIASALASGELSIKKTTRHIEQTLIRRALDETEGNRTAAAKLLEISHRALLYKLKDYGIK